MAEQVETKVNILYDKKIDLGEVRANPILGPIFGGFSGYKSLSLDILKSTYEAEEIIKRINDLADLNPTLQRTIIWGDVQKLLSCMKQIIFSSNNQNDITIKVINEMVDANDKYYSLIGNNLEKPVLKKIESKELSEDEKFPSELFGKDLPVPVGVIKNKRGRPKGKRGETDFMEQFCSKCGKRISTVMRKNYDEKKLCINCKDEKAKEFGIESPKKEKMEENSEKDFLNG